MLLAVKMNGAAILGNILGILYLFFKWVEPMDEKNNSFLNNHTL